MARGNRWIAETFDTRAATYDESEMHRRQAERAVRLLAPQPGQRVLDVAAGTGLVARQVASAVGDDGLVVGVDLSQGMLEVGPGRWHRVRADAHRLPFGDAAFDAVTCLAAIPYFADADRTLVEMRRVSTPVATLVLTVPAVDGLVLHRLLREAAAVHGLAVADPHAGLGAEPQLQARLEPLGLTVQQVEVVRHAYPLTGDPQGVFDQVIAYGFADELQQAPAPLRAAVAGTYRAAYGRMHGGGEDRWLLVRAGRTIDQAV